MTIEGSLRTMSAAELLGWIRTRGAPGKLAVRRDALLRTFETDGETITWVSSNRPDDVLSQVLRARGLIDAEGLERAASVEVASGVMLGQALIAAEVLPASKVREVLDSQIREATMDILSWNRGAFRFVPDRSDRRSRVDVTVDIVELLAIGRGLAADWGQLRVAAPTLATRFWQMKEFVPGDYPDSPEAQARHRWLLDELEGRDFGGLIASANAERFVTTADLAVLLGREIIGVVPRAPGQSLSREAIEWAAAARTALAEGDYAFALELARVAADTDRNSAELAQLVGNTERAVVGHLSRELLASHRIPRQIADAGAIEAAQLTAEESYALSRVDGVWDLFSLITSSALGEVASLVTYKQLDDRGLIAL